VSGNPPLVLTFSLEFNKGIKKPKNFDRQNSRIFFLPKLTVLF